jgi:hypothetical protein
MGFEFTPPAWLGGLVFGGIGAVGIAFGVVAWCKATALKRRGLRAEATVIGKRTWVKRSCGRSSCPLRFVKVRWEDAAGRKRVAEGIVNRIYGSTSVGDHVPILYVPQDRRHGEAPDFAFVDEPSSVGGIIGCFLFSLAFVGVGIAAFMSLCGGVGK